MRFLFKLVLYLLFLARLFVTPDVTRATTLIVSLYEGPS